MVFGSKINISVEFLPPELGGRSRPLQITNSTEYRPHLVVVSEQGESEYLGVQFLSPLGEFPVGELVSAVLKPIYPAVDYSPLFAGQNIEVREGAKVVATGIVT